MPATAHHIADLLPRVRKADHDEFAVSCSGTVENGLRLGLLISQQAYAGVTKGGVVAITGLYKPTLTCNFGVPWMVGSVTLEDRRIQKHFMRASRSVLGKYLADAGRLENWVDSRNTVAIRWLRQLGFTIHPATLYGPKKMMFHRFEIGG